MNTCNFPNKLIYNRLFKNILIKSNLYIPTMVAQTVKNLPAMKETWVWSLGWEDPLEEGMATHSSILGWRIPCIVHGVRKSWIWLSDFHYNHTATSETAKWKECTEQKY